MEWGNPLLDDHVLALSGVERPKICFLPTASGDADHYVVRFYRAFPAPRCEPSHISLFRRETGVGDPRAHLLAQDVIYVGGGSLVSLMGTWRAHGLDHVLHEAWRAGVRAVRRLGRVAVLVLARGVGLPRGPAAPAGGPRLPALDKRRALQRRARPARGVHGCGRRRDASGYGVGDAAALHFVGHRAVRGRLLAARGPGPLRVRRRRGRRGRARAAGALPGRAASSDGRDRTCLVVDGEALAA